jgi:predicted nucleic acid-binding protein
LIVLDASAALTGLLTNGQARRAMAAESLHAPHLIDSEILHGLRRRVLAGDLDADVARAVLEVWRQLAVVRYPVIGTVGRMWELRDNVSAYDAGYVALAEALDCSLLTADARLASAPGVQCAMTVVTT